MTGRAVQTSTPVAAERDCAGDRAGNAGKPDLPVIATPPALSTGDPRFREVGRVGAETVLFDRSSGHYLLLEEG